MSVIPRLVVIEGKEKGKVITLTDGTAVIGRSKGDVIIQDARISRSHIAVHFDSRTGKLSFTDLKSLNGSTVNGKGAEAGELHDGDKLQVGNTLFDCQIVPAGEEFTSTSEILARSRDKEKRAAERRPIPRPAEMYTGPLTEDKLIELNDLEDSSGGRKEPGSDPDHVTASTPIKRKREWTRPNLAVLRVAKLKISPRTRNILLLLIVLGAGLKYLSLPGMKTEKTNAEMEKSLLTVQMLQTNGRHDEAVKEIEALKKKFPETSTPYLLAGDVYSSQGKNQQAIESYLAANRYPPEQPLVHIKLIRVYLRSGMTREAATELREVERVINERKFSRELFIEAGYLFLEFKELKEPPEKTIILAKALQKEYAPDSSIGYKLEAQAHFQENRPQDALNAMEKGRMIDPQDEWLIENSVFAKIALKDMVGAESLLEEWLKMKPTATKALLVFGYLRYNEKNYPQALPYVQKILQIDASKTNDPYYGEALNLMAQIYQELQQPTEASKFYKQACAAGFQQSCDNALVKNDAAANEGSSVPQPASLPSSSAMPPASEQILNPPANRQPQTKTP